MKVRKIKLRFAPPKPIRPRNPVAVALTSKRGGEHKKSNKAMRVPPTPPSRLPYQASS